MLKKDLTRQDVTSSGENRKIYGQGSEEGLPIIGFYDYTVVLTYLSLSVSVLGMMLSIGGHNLGGLICLALSGFLDMFDGKVARTKKNRTEDEKNFGIQIDSLTDIVCFGASPVVLCYNMGMKHPVGMAILIYYCLCGMIRLGYFNILEMNRQKESTDKCRFYRGLPITSVSVILPVVLFVSIRLFPAYQIMTLYLTMAATGTLFVLNFRFRKPDNRELAIIVGIAALALSLIIIHKLSGYYALRNM